MILKMADLKNLIRYIGKWKKDMKPEDKELKTLYAKCMYSKKSQKFNTVL